MSFDARTATPEEFEAEARRTHAEVVARFDAMTEEERAAWDQFSMPGYERRLKQLRLNQISSVAGLETNIATCVEHYRRVNHQNSNAHARERDARIEADRRRAREEREREAKAEAERRNAAAAERADEEREAREAQRRQRTAEQRERMREAAESRRRESEAANERAREQAQARREAERAAEDPVVAAVRTILAQSNPERFTKSGRPRCSLLRLLVGRRVSAAERDRAWREARG